MLYGMCGRCHTNFVCATPTFCPFIIIGHTNFDLLVNHIMFWPHQLWKPSSADAYTHTYIHMHPPIHIETQQNPVFYDRDQNQTNPNEDGLSQCPYMGMKSIFTSVQSVAWALTRYLGQPKSCPKLSASCPIWGSFPRLGQPKHGQWHILYIIWWLCLPQNVWLCPKFLKTAPNFWVDTAPLPRRDLVETCHILQAGIFRSDFVHCLIQKPRIHRKKVHIHKVFCWKIKKNKYCTGKKRIRKPPKCGYWPSWTQIIPKCL